MNILFINIFFVRFMVSEIPRVSVFRQCPYSVTFPYNSYETVFQLYKFEHIQCRDIRVLSKVNHASIVSISAFVNSGYCVLRIMLYTYSIYYSI